MCKTAKPVALSTLEMIQLSQVKKKPNLGVVFDEIFSLKSHVNSLCTSARYYLHNIRLARKYFTQGAAEKAIHAFVKSRLDCNNHLLYGLPRCKIEKLKKIQNTAARILTGAKRDIHITPVLKHLHWLPISCRIKYKILTLTYKCINKISILSLCLTNHHI